jgi:hypothetical protein
LQRTQLLDDQEPEDDSRPAGSEEVLQALPEAYAAQRSEIEQWPVAVVSGQKAATEN